MPFQIAVSLQNDWFYGNLKDIKLKRNPSTEYIHCILNFFLKFKVN